MPPNLRVGWSTANLYPQITLGGTAGLQALNAGLCSIIEHRLELAAGLTGPLFRAAAPGADRQASNRCAGGSDARRYQENGAWMRSVKSPTSWRHSSLLRELEAQRHSVGPRRTTCALAAG